MICGLCLEPGQSNELNRSNGVDLCAACFRLDPAPMLARRGIDVVWNGTQASRALAVLNAVTRPSLDLDLGRSFHALVTLPHTPNFSFHCVPEKLLHKVAKLVHAEPEVGDTIFDKRVYVRTETPETLHAYLTQEGVQSSMLSLFSNVVVDATRSNHVALQGDELVVSVYKGERQTDFSEQKLMLDVVGLLLPILEHCAPEHRPQPPR